MSKKMSAGAKGTGLLICLAVAASLAGCAGEMDDLVQYVATTKQQAKSPIEPIPTLREYEPYSYPEHLRQPFDQEALASLLASRAAATVVDIPALDPGRPIEFLEAFPLDALRMVGTLKQGDRVWGLIRIPDGAIHRVLVGDYMGQNYGQITAITETGIDLIEVIPDITAGYRERPMTVALQAE